MRGNHYNLWLPLKSLLAVAYLVKKFLLQNHNLLKSQQEIAAKHDRAYATEILSRAMEKIVPRLYEEGKLDVHYLGKIWLFYIITYSQ